MILKLLLMFFVLKLFSSFAVFVSSKNLSIVECSNALGCNRYESAQLYVFGGYDGKDNRLSAASQFNSSTGEWDSINDMWIRKHVMCGAVVRTKIYLFGGNAMEHNGPSKTAEVYDCETGTYSEYRALSRYAPGHGCGAAVLNGFIYVAGGWDGSKLMSNVVRYNIQTTRREDIKFLHMKRDGLQLVELGGRLYAIGGGTNVVESYNPNTDRWMEVASSNYAHQHFGTAVHEGKIYALSHLGFEVYSPEYDQWKTLPSLNNLESSRLVSMNGRLWALGGGIKSNWEATKSVSMFNIITNTWNKQMDMDVARMYHAAFVVNH